MTRLLCFGDLHLGAGTEYGTPERSRLDDQRAVLGQILEVMLERECDAFLFAGDVTHHRSVIEEVAAFQDFLAEKQALRFIGVPGNHDRSTMGFASTLEVAAGGSFGYDTSIIPRPWLVVEPAYTVACLPWCPTSQISAMDPTGQVDDVSRTVVEILMDVARGLLAESRERHPDLPCILLGHWSAAGAVTPAGAIVDEFREPVLPTVELAEIGFDAVVLGHIHSAGPIIESHVPVFYTGSPAVVDFGEAGHAHGVWILEVELGKTRLEFVPLRDRPFVTVTYLPELGCCQHPEQDLDGAIVRVRYEATVEQERTIDHEAIKAQLYGWGAHKVYAIQPTILRADGTRAEITEDVAVDDAFAQWLASQDVELAQVERVGAAHHEIREAVAR